MLRNALLVGLIVLVASALAACDFDTDHQREGWLPDAQTGWLPDAATGWLPDAATLPDAETGRLPDAENQTCGADSQCPAGAYCDPSTGVCTSSAICDPQTPCPQGMMCDPSRATCVPSGSDVPSCGGTITCNTAPPTCPAGETAAIQDGCYTGSCITTANCDVPPPPTACSDITTEADCTSRSDCIPVYTGVDCTNANGGTCKEGDTGCTCASFKYSSCADAPQ